MRCTAVPHTGHGCLYFPWTAKSSRNAVTFSGNFSRASCRSRSVHSFSTAWVASNRARTSSADIFRVSRAGDSFARWRISSEYALPIPDNKRGSVSERFSVWFSRRSADSNSSRVEASGSIPPRSNSSSARARWIEARFFVAASVSTSVPEGKSRAASPTFPGIFAPRSSHLNRPAIIRWITRNSPPSSMKTIRLPRRRTSSTRRPLATLSGGSKVRTTKGLATRTPCRGWPAMRDAIDST